MSGRVLMVVLGGAGVLALIYVALSVLVWDLGAPGPPDLAPFAEPAHYLGTDRSGRDWVRVLAIAGLADAAVVVFAVTFTALLAILLGALAGAGLTWLGGVFRTVGAGSVLLIGLAGSALVQAHGGLPGGPLAGTLLMILLFALAASAEPAERIRRVLVAEQTQPHYRAAAELGVPPATRFLRHALPAIWVELRGATYRSTIAITIAWLSFRFLVPGAEPASLGNLIAEEAGRFDPALWWHLANPAGAAVVTLLMLCLLAEGRRV